MPTNRPDPTKAEIIGSPAKSAPSPVDAFKARAGIQDVDTEGLNAAILEAEQEATAHELTQRQAVAMDTSSRNEPVIPDVTSERDQAMLDAAAGRTVRPVAFSDPSRVPAAIGGDARMPGAYVWDGIPREFTLAHPVMHNQGLVKEGEKIVYDVSPVMVTDPATGYQVPTGRFVGTGGPDDQGEFVSYLFRMGMFKDTLPSDIRDSKQAAMDNERGVIEATRLGSDESGNAIVQPAMSSLRQQTGAQIEQKLREHRGIASPAVMLQAERMAAMAGAEAPGSSGPRAPRSE